MNPYWQTFPSPKNTIMSSHSAVWSQLRLPCACFLSLHKRNKGWCLTWGCQGHTSMAASHACVHSHVGNTSNHVKRNKHYRLNALQTHKHTHIQSVATIFILKIAETILMHTGNSLTDYVCCRSYVWRVMFWEHALSATRRTPPAFNHTEKNPAAIRVCVWWTARKIIKIAEVRQKAGCKCRGAIKRQQRRKLKDGEEMHYSAVLQRTFSSG